MIEKGKSIKHLLSDDFLLKEEYLKGTPFFKQRQKIKVSYLFYKVPSYRLMKVLDKINDEYEFKDFKLFFNWLQLSFNKYDEDFKSVKRFRANYGYYRVNRNVLTLRNAIELYFDTKE